ncbi:MAG: hypothetical protein U0350_48875 [Caldilineaceae bacterium]
MQVSTLQTRLNGLSSRERAIADVVARLIVGVGRAHDVEIHHLRTYGLRDSEIHEVLELATSAHQQNAEHTITAAEAESAPALLPYYFEGTIPPGV